MCIRDRYKLCSHKWKLLLPSCMIDELIWECHLSLGHAGFKKCHLALTESFIGKGLAKRMKRLLSTCDLCQKCKHPNLATRVEMQTVQAKVKGELLAVDYYGPLPKAKGGVKHLSLIHI